LTGIQWYKKKLSLSGNITLVKKSLFTHWSEANFECGIYVKIDNIHLLNVHLDDVSCHKRKKQLDQLRPILEQKHVILAGDFNQSYKKDSTLYRLPDFKVHNQCITYFVEKNMVIDNILTKGFRISPDTCNPVPDTVEKGLDLYGSDHIPVTATVY
jgi:endonuclease/exonuclease/phosphatase family metal-dependent hydrolase